MDNSRVDWVINNLTKVYEQMDFLEKDLFSFAIKELNNQFDDWDKMNKIERQLTIEGFKGIIELSLAGETL
ncbi:MAG: hypothetical protein P8P37_01665 [Candidatus Marinimicrobia bacterium]|nr:hypothetical protein [Candidatus Neomarinimicrobiota bacterium]